MIIKEMFTKPIDRAINGVIKVEQSDDYNMQQELKEYVVTNELEKHFRKFYSNYKYGINNDTDKVGVWISGFFGSGKSHFLKMLSYLLANKEIAGKHAIEYFKEDNKISDAMTMADMELAANVDTDVILFNIDNKGNSNSRQDQLSIVAVFQNAFNEMLGYCGPNPFVADLERNLDDRGLYAKFKETFEKINGSDWKNARFEFDFIQDDVVDALVEIEAMSDASARNLCEKAMVEYNYSIENFVRLVSDYINKKGNNRHVVFLVDEIGQYIGENSQLMLGLQTVTEQLGIHCKGNAWVIVTSQEDIDAISCVISNDFSKIQGRFNTRISLSSANVDEVIQKRILDKNDAGKATLKMIYDENKTKIKNLITFDDAVEKKWYADSKNFAEVYPFIPYQFDLMGHVLNSVRLHSSSGKHLAEGERTMLAIFKESAERVMVNEANIFVPFNVFYDALEEWIDSPYSSVITKASKNSYLNPNNEKDCFDVRVLKCLFLIKYVDMVMPTVENITSLMVDSFDCDRLALKENVQKALDRLCVQFLVQKDGNRYKFLTNEEQDITREISAIVIEPSAIIKKVSEMIFDEIYPEKNYKYVAKYSTYNFGFNQIVDDIPYRTHADNELKFKIMTPFSDNRENETKLKLASGQESCIFVVMPEDITFWKELKCALQIGKFLTYGASKIGTNFTKLVSEKQEEREHRLDAARVYLKENLKQADIYVDGNRVEVGSKEITPRFNEAIKTLTEKLYYKINYISSEKTQGDVLKVLKDDGSQLVVGDIDLSENKLALREVSDFVFLRTQNYMKISLKAVTDNFKKQPFGFKISDINWLVAKLFKDGELALFMNNEPISLANNRAEDIAKYLTSSSFSEKIMLERKQHPKDKYIQSVKKIMKLLFGTLVLDDDEDKIMVSFHHKAKLLDEDLEKYNREYQIHPKYPGKELIATGRRLMQDAINLNYALTFFETLDKNMDDYMDFADDYYELKGFFEGEQKKYFDKGLRIMEMYEISKNYNLGVDLKNIVESVETIINSKNPYSAIKNLPELDDKFNTKYSEIMIERQKPIEDFIETTKGHVISVLTGAKCHDEFVDKVLGEFKDLSNKAESCGDIVKLEAMRTEIPLVRKKWLDIIEKRENELTEKITDNPDGDNGEEVKPVVVIPKFVNIRDIERGNNWKIESKEDIDKYVNELEKKLIKLLDENEIVNVEFN